MAKNKKSSTPQLDLHGVKHADVEQMVEDYVLLNETPLRIITGNSQPMKDIVRKVLLKHQFKFDDGGFFQGCVTVF